MTDKTKKIIAREGLVIIGVVALSILLSGCDILLPPIIKVPKEQEPAHLTRTVLEYWKNGDYATPKKFWDESDLEDYSYLSDIDSYQVVFETRFSFVHRVTARVKFKAKNGTTVKKLFLFNFAAANGKWRIYLMEEAESYFFFFAIPKGKTQMSLPKYRGQDQSRVSRSK